MGLLTLPAAVLVAAAVGITGPWFTDVTDGSGIPSLKYAEGVNAVDITGDGLPELFLPVVKGRDRLYRNLGGMRYIDVTDERGIKESCGIGAVMGDLDGDGLKDLYVVRGAYPYGKNVLYRQGTGGVFNNVSGAACVKDKRNGIGAVLADFGGAGRPDIFVTNWGADALYENVSTPGTMSFKDTSISAGLGEEGRSWAAVASDFNCDGWTDLLAVRGGFDKPEQPKLYMNRGDGTFEDASGDSGLKGVTWSMGAVSADFDGDGDIDVFIAGYDGPDRLFINDGAGRFQDATDRSGITSGHSVGAAAGDIDGDLRPDIVVSGYAGPVRVFRNLGGGKFKEVKDAGLGKWKKNEGVALADLDGDGDLDLYVANYDGHNRLYRNDTGGGPSLKVRPTSSGHAAIGATVRLYRSGGLGKKGALLATQEIQAGYGFCSQSPAEALFRLPDNKAYDISATFPGGVLVTKSGVKPGTITIERPK